MEICNRIMTSLNIDWNRVTWRDLLKPLYSGLAASLYVQIVRGPNLPGDIAAQGLIWKTIYSPREPVSTFVRTANLSDSCSAELDLVFIVDTSGSIGPLNFEKVRDFLTLVVRGLQIGADHVRVGTVSFSSFPYLDFRLTTHHTEAGVIKGINSIMYDAGGTDTALGINMAVNDVFSENYGMRRGSAKVALLVTDGMSYDTDATVAAAQRAKNAGIVFFTIGVGSVNVNELQAVATSPNCTHVFLMENFTEIQTVLHEIRKSACRAQIRHILEKQVNVSKSLPFNKTTVSININNNTNVANNETTVTVLTTVNCGVVRIYASYETTHPGPAFHEITDTATDGTPSYLTVNKSVDGRPLYIAYVGSKLPTNVSGIGECLNATMNSVITDGPPKEHEVLCKENGVERECTKVDFITSPYKKYMCADTFLNVENPCTSDALTNTRLFFPHPFHTTKFIRCDFLGNMYITECPPGTLYNAGTGTCGSEHRVTSYGEKLALGPTVSNPCTGKNIMEGKRFFEYPRDETKFIHCDSWGYASLLSCRPGDIWFQNVQTCSRHVTHTTTGTTQPTHHELCSTGREFLLHPSDPHKYIHCVPGGNYFVQSCPVHMVFDITINVCIREKYHGPYIG
ncbi:collagen alpha-1(XII) chain-like [Gigantopelta aegis]|uniref:collagen alpha-1(XII) chain-like n=1 Tax=Gigantopelta aegis TaxID=1735272 RepID=UPI001B887BEA|nr:collagen alpha-1(XII) chain-like [Gigantopelta aegis]